MAVAVAFVVGFVPDERFAVWGLFLDPDRAAVGVGRAAEAVGGWFSVTGFWFWVSGFWLGFLLFGSGTDFRLLTSDFFFPAAVFFSRFVVEVAVAVQVCGGVE